VSTPKEWTSLPLVAWVETHGQCSIIIELNNFNARMKKIYMNSHGTNIVHAEHGN
jgi:hypothetical protein